MRLKIPKEYDQSTIPTTSDHIKSCPSCQPKKSMCPGIYIGNHFSMINNSGGRKGCLQHCAYAQKCRQSKLVSLGRSIPIFAAIAIKVGMANLQIWFNDGKKVLGDLKVLDQTLIFGCSVSRQKNHSAKIIPLVRGSDRDRLVINTRQIVTPFFSSARGRRGKSLGGPPEADHPHGRSISRFARCTVSVASPKLNVPP